MSVLGGGGAVGCLFFRFEHGERERSVQLESAGALYRYAVNFCEASEKFCEYLLRDVFGGGFQVKGNVPDPAVGVPEKMDPAFDPVQVQPFGKSHLLELDGQVAEVPIGRSYIFVANTDEGSAGGGQVIVGRLVLADQKCFRSAGCRHGLTGLRQQGGS